MFKAWRTVKIVPPDRSNVYLRGTHNGYIWVYRSSPTLDSDTLKNSASTGTAGSHINSGSPEVNSGQVGTHVRWQNAHDVGGADAKLTVFVIPKTLSTPTAK